MSQNPGPPRVSASVVCCQQQIDPPSRTGLVAMGLRSALLSRVPRGLVRIPYPEPAQGNEPPSNLLLTLESDLPSARRTG